MDRLIDYLRSRPIFTVLISLVYYIIVVTTHKQVGRFIANNLDKPLGRDAYNLLVTVVSLVSLALVIFFLNKGFRKLDSGNRKRVLLYLTSILVLIVVAVNMIMVVNVELIHVAQYCVLAILLFPLLKNFNLTLLVCVILGAVDEAYQHYYLFPEKSNYFDFNDIILDSLGAVLGLVLLMSQGISDIWSSNSEINKPVLIIIGIISTLVILALLSGFLIVMPDPDNETAKIQLIRKYKPGFWRVLKKQGIKFHIIRPLEFVFLITGLLFAYRKLGLKRY